MKFISAKNVALLVAAGLIASMGTAIAADTENAAVAGAQTRAAYQSSMSTYIASHRAIVDTRRAARAKALTDFQSALASVTTDAQLQAAQDARMATLTEADTTAKAALVALARPEHTKPAEATPAP